MSNKSRKRQRTKTKPRTLHPMASFLGLPTTKELAGLQKRLKRIANCELRIADFKK